MSAIQTRGVQVSLGGTEVLHGIDLVLPAGRWTAIVGPNGAGKSTLLKAMAGLLPHAGSVALLATDGPERFARVGAVFLGQPLAPEDVEIVDLAFSPRPASA